MRFYVAFLFVLLLVPTGAQAQAKWNISGESGVNVQTEAAFGDEYNVGVSIGTRVARRVTDRLWGTLRIGFANYRIDDNFVFGELEADLGALTDSSNLGYAIEGGDRNIWSFMVGAQWHLPYKERTSFYVIGDAGLNLIANKDLSAVVVEAAGNTLDTAVRAERGGTRAHFNTALGAGARFWLAAGVWYYVESRFEVNFGDPYLHFSALRIGASFNI